MGSSPKQAPASGSGTTVQGSILPTDIVDQSQNAFRNQLNGTVGQTSGLANFNNAPRMVGSFNPDSMNLATVGSFDPGNIGLTRIGNFAPNDLGLQKEVATQGRSSSYDLGPLYSNNLDPLVQGQLSKTFENRAGITNLQNSKIAESLGADPSNAALIASLQAKNNMGASLSEGPARLAALTQQREFDLATRGANERAASLDLERMNQFNNANLAAGEFANNARLADRSAAERAFGINSDVTNQNNQSALAERSAIERAYGLNSDAINQNNQTILAGRSADERSYGLNADAIQANNAANNAAFDNRIKSTQLSQDLLKTLGEGLISTTPQAQYNFTLADLGKLNSNPALISNPALYSGGLIGESAYSSMPGLAKIPPPQVIQANSGVQNRRGQRVPFNNKQYPSVR